MSGPHELSTSSPICFFFLYHENSRLGLNFFYGLDKLFNCSDAHLMVIKIVIHGSWYVLKNPDVWDHKLFSESQSIAWNSIYRLPDPIQFFQKHFVLLASQNLLLYVRGIWIFPPKLNLFLTCIPKQFPLLQSLKQLVHFFFDVFLTFHFFFDVPRPNSRQLWVMFILNLLGQTETIIPPSYNRTQLLFIWLKFLCIRLFVEVI